MHYLFQEPPPQKPTYTHLKKKKKTQKTKGQLIQSLLKKETYTILWAITFYSATNINVWYYIRYLINTHL